MSQRIPNRVFISYSRRDSHWVDRLCLQLAPLIRANRIDLWVDKGEIQPGDQYIRNIQTAIDTSSYAILLVSANFQASEFIASHELPRLQDAANADHLRLLWLPVGHCVIADEFANVYHTIGDPQHPLNDLTETQADRVLAEVARTLSNDIQNPTIAQVHSSTVSKAASEQGIRSFPPHERSKTGSGFAGFWIRLAALAIDLAVVFLLVFPGAFLLLEGSESGYRNTLPKFDRDLADQVVGCLTFTLLFFLSACLESSRWQATLGKRLVGICVIDYDFRRLTFWRAALRFAFKVPSYMLFGCGCFLAAFSKRKQALHDLLAKTYVHKKTAP